MTKSEYLNALEKALSGLPQEEIRKSLDFYAEILDDALENGENEIEAVSRLGSVEETAQKIINETPLVRLVKENVSRRRVSGAEIALIAVLSPIWLPLAAAVLAVIFSLWLSLWAIAASLFAACIGFAAGGLALLAAAPFFTASDKPKAVLSLGLGLMCAGCAVFIFFGALLFSKLIIKLTAYSLRKIKGGFIGERGSRK